MRTSGLAPQVQPDCRVLVLGSFPGTASLAAGEYYAHPRNHFWRLVGDSIGVDMAALAYVARLRVLHDAGIGLWDVIGRCRRKGSLDSAIRDAEYNDFGALIQRCPQLRLACFNGKVAARQISHVGGFGLETRVLPSSSPANTMPYERKLSEWQLALGTASGV